MFNVVFFGSNGKALASKIDASSLLVGDGLYYGSNQLTNKTFSNEFASIVSGRYMFNSSNIKTFSGSLTSLQDGTRMFEATSSFTSFTSEMPNLSNGTYMFFNTPLLANFSSSLPNLRIGEYMFQNATALPSFSVSLPKLTNGARMFDNCTSLETFNSVLPSLENGSYMFQGCKLSGRSVRNIVESLPTHETQHSITIGINCTENIEGQREFLRETGYNTFEEIEDALAAKSWKVVWHFQGFPSGWRPVEYLESTGPKYSDQYFISTACMGDETEVTFSAPYVDDTNRIFGGAHSPNLSHLVGIASNSRAFVRLRNEEVSFVYEPAAGHDLKHTFTIKNDEITFNGTKISGTNYSMPTFPANLRMTIFGESSFDENDNIIKAIYSRPGTRVYSFKSWRDEAAHSDLVPCVDNVGNPCMYDKVSKTSLYSQTGDKFLVPTTSATYSLRQPVAEFAQLTDSGVRKLYHLPYDYEGTLEEFVEENGFKQLVENEKPEEGNWMPEWTDTEDAVVLNWVEVPEEIVEA